MFRPSLGKLAATLATPLATLGAILIAGGFPIAPSPATAATRAPGSSSRLAIGAVTQALADNSTHPWTKSDLSQVVTFEQAIQTHAAIVMWYADWAHGKVDLAQLRAISSRGSLPEITWEPRNYLRAARQPQYTLASIIAGRHDAYILSWARVLHAYGKPVLLRFAQEMNGGRYPWSEGVNGNRTGQFAKAWRHVYNIFKRAHAWNVRWVWSELARGGAPLNAGEYPGDAYVNIVGLSGFNGGTALKGWGGWRSFGGVFDHSLDMLRMIAPHKPIQISEVGTASLGGSAPAWVTGMFRDLARRPDVRSLLWFDVKKQADWRITGRMAARFAAGLRWLRAQAG